MASKEVSPNTPPLLTQAEIDKKPWKYIGYRKYSAWVASSDSFFHVRKFRTLNARVILSLQDDIVVSEEKLKELDNACSLITAGVINNGSFRDDKQTARIDTMNQLKLKLLEYNNFINSHSILRERPPVPQEEVRNSYAWHWNNHGAILDEEKAYITHEDDLMAICPREKGYLHKVTGRFMLAKRLPFFRRNPDGKEPYDSHTHYLTRFVRIDNLVSGMILLAGLAVLIAPLWILHAVDDDTTRLWIITGFVVTFLVVVNVVCGAKPGESLGATAAYAAVLIVFITLGKDSH